MEKGQVPLMPPPNHRQVFARCVDDTLPNKFTPDSWIEKGKIYKVKYFVESLNTDNICITITNNAGEEIHPSDSIFSFKIDRFEIFDICLN